ncbi:mitochondrial mRNA pseudouridine synthase TRUB2 [Callorhinchus milii]|nr:mitochondrial mRNA pseudouridine synthase TRUB2 [Callorhinchus milii]XP_042193565.1 mitochondrial mRNA pseudouridine synthase TRUB2 [Callorhinchus milii]|eukprot:gi/632964493/ref/XP_007898423.1/ PREDICTED: probable tRNA pseudouridine synthase 2 [Callorhinchus milii]
MSRSARSVARALQGLFSVYKPPGVHWKRVRDAVETNLLQELNSLKQPDARQLIRFLPVHADGESETETNLTVVKLPALADHPLVKGPEFVHLKVGTGHRLDVMSSGVFVLALGHGNKQLPDLYNCHLTKDYTVKGFFGKATDDFSDMGRLVEKTTYDHITRDKLERIVAVIQGSHQKALLTYSGIDFKTQEAYELASRGLLRPMQNSPPIITGLRCVHFSPPNFTLEIQCLHETQKYLRRIVHEIGLELKSTAVCTHVRRTRDGFFTLQDSLIRTRWDLQSVQDALRGRGSKGKATLLESGLEPPAGETDRLQARGQRTTTGTLRTAQTGTR